MKPILALPAALVATCAALAGSSHRTTWELRNFTWVKLARQEKGAEPNDHPALVDKEALQRALAGIRFGDEALFEAAELKMLARPLAEALAEARPDEDLNLLSTNRRGGGMMAPELGLMARLFVRDGRLNVIVHETRSGFMDRIQARDWTPAFTYGSRTEAGSVALTGAARHGARADWVEIPLAGMQPVPAQLPVIVAAPAPAAPAVAPAPSAAAPAPAAVEEDQEKRLRKLKHLREENLITEEEYQKKRKEILDRL